MVVVVLSKSSSFWMISQTIKHPKACSRQHFCQVHKFHPKKFPIHEEEERSLDAKTDILLQLLICTTLTHLTIAAPINKPLYLFSQPKLHRISTQIGFCSQGPIFAFFHLLFAIWNKIETAAGARFRKSGLSLNCNNSPLLIPFGPGCANKSKSIELHFANRVAN